MIDVVRPAEAPASLSARVKYNGEDVRRALYSLFLRKCYLCETPVGLGTFEVDHRRPKGEQEDQTFVWENLFPACSEHKCNQRREKTYPQGGLLSPGEGVESRILQHIELSRSSSLHARGSTTIRFRGVDPTDVAARNTAVELDRIHNGTGSTALDAAQDLRIKIHEHVMTVMDTAFQFLHPDTAGDPQKARDIEDLMRLFVSRRAPYSMLVRSVVERLPAIRALFD